jgi:Protein of unknown function (DUF3570)
VRLAAATRSETQSAEVQGLSSLFVAAALALLQPRSARADSGISYRYEDYRESGGRIDVRTNGTIAEQDVGTDLHIKVGGVIDTIAGATPSGQPAPTGSDQVPLSRITDRRKAWNGEVSYQFPSVNVAAGFSRSLEHDYVSNGWSLNTLTAFNRRNTTLLVGAAGTDDNVEVFFLPEWLRKRSTDGIVGITQLLDPLTSVTVDISATRTTGMLNEPYKLVQRTIQILPGISLPETFAENRPNSRDRETFLALVDRAFPAAHGSIEASYRYYHDTYGIGAHTLEATWFQKVGPRLILEPNARIYRQDAADFYHYNLDSTSIIPTTIPNPLGAHYASDARLSAFNSLGYGLTVVWTASALLQFTVSESGYTQHGTDGVTPQSAYYKASITGLGARISW